MNKPTKINDNTWTYRGFTIKRNFVSPNGTRQVCSTQQGYAVTPGNVGGSSGINGDWKPSIKSAVESIDYLYRNYATLSRQGREIVDEAKKLDSPAPPAWLAELGFAWDTTGSEFGVRPAWRLGDDVEVTEGDDYIVVIIADGQFRSLYLDFAKWGRTAAVAIAKAAILSRNE